MPAFNAIGMDAVGASGATTQGSNPTPGDTLAPSMTGNIALSAITTTGAHAVWQAATDAVGVTGYEMSVDAGTPVWFNVGNVLAYDIAGWAPGSTYTVRLRAYDAALNYATPITTALTTLASPSTPATPSTPSAPTTADISVFTIMQVSTINLQAMLGPVEINLTVSLT